MDINGDHFSVNLTKNVMLSLGIGISEITNLCRVSYAYSQ